MQKAAVYVRVSTEDQIEYSPASQIRKIEEYALRNQISISPEHIFQDEGISGRSAKKRPAFMKMIHMAKEKPRPFDMVLVWKFSRFARSRQDSIFYKSMLRKEYGIDVISITEQLSDDPTSILIEALLEAMDEYYSLNLAQEVKRGMQEKFQQGGVVSIPAFGYQMQEGEFVPEPKKAECVRLMYEWFLQGKSCRQIASELNDRGIWTNRGNLWESRTVKYVLTNPVYIGKMRRHRAEHDGYDRYYKGEHVEIVRGRQVPIVSEEVFYAVQEKLSKPLGPPY